jgi:hypothetical protein
MLPTSTGRWRFSGRDFTEVMEESTFVAPADRVEDSDDLDSNDFSSDEAHKKAIQVEPLDCRPPSQLRKNRFLNFGLKES